MTLPNALSFSRLPIGLVVYVLASQHIWGWALALLVIGCATDVLDGWIAEQFNMTSKLGGEVLEPVCDTILIAGAIIGLNATDTLSWWVTVAMLALGGLVQAINSFFTESVLFARFGMWFMPCYYLIVVWLLVLEYGNLAIEGQVTRGFLLAVVLIVTAYLIRLKRHRFAVWFSGDPNLLHA